MVGVRLPVQPQQQQPQQNAYNPGNLHIDVFAIELYEHEVFMATFQHLYFCVFHAEQAELEQFFANQQVFASFDEFMMHLKSTFHSFVHNNINKKYTCICKAAIDGSNMVVAKELNRRNLDMLAHGPNFVDVEACEQWRRRKNFIGTVFHSIEQYAHLHDDQPLLKDILDKVV